MSKRVALVTGSSRGIGRAIAMRLARDRFAVAVNYVGNRDKAEEVVRQIVAAGGTAVAIQADLAEKADCERLLKDVHEKLGPIDVLVNNAALATRLTVDTFDMEAFDRMRRTNFDAVIHLVLGSIGHMKSKGWGRIINISSVSGVGTATPDVTFYATTKASLNVFTRRLAFELGKFGITVNAVAPGVVRTDILEGSSLDLDAVAKSTMVGRLGDPDDIAAAVSYFAREESAYTTAQVLIVDGGRSNYLSHT